MSNTIFELLTNTELRSTEALERTVARTISAGLPWLTGKE